MSGSDPIDGILQSLRERAKELHCLYEVDATLSEPDATLEQILGRLSLQIPPGYQYPEVCIARIVLDGVAYAAPGFRETPWVQSAQIVVQGKRVGRVDVYYTEPMPGADHGPFLKEERKLIETIAERIGHHVMQRRLQAALKEWQGLPREAALDKKRQWRVIIDFLETTDRQLLARLSRKMLNHLCWSGVAEAQELLRGMVAEPGLAEDVGLDDNRPMETRAQDSVAVAAETFRIAATHLPESEMVTRIQEWIKDDRASFLLEALENRGTSLSDIAEALQRYRRIGVDETELTRPMRTALRVALVRRFFSDDLAFIGTAKDFAMVSDFYQIAQRVLGPPGSHGRLGGKSAGLFLAAQIVRNSPELGGLLSGLRVPKTWYVASDGLLDFIQHNHLEDVYNRKYLALDQVRAEYPHIVQVFKNSSFPPEMVKGLSMALDDFENRPLIVRSSSLLEDRAGAAFSGKYKSLFLANRGAKHERLAALLDAIAEVYASIFGPDPLEYRTERGLIDLHEEMAIMIQEVVGARVGPYFLPAFSGVAFSNNEFRWSARISREDGLLRIVPGLGTRAVDRTADDYPVLIAPGRPGLRANVSPDEVIRYSPRMVDAVNLETRTLESVEVRKLFREWGASFPSATDIVSFADADGVRRPLGFEIESDAEHLVVTFEGLIQKTPFVARMKALLQVLREKLGGPVDIEFASDGEHLYLLQCRPQSYAEDTAPTPIPADVPADSIVFSANRYVSNGRVGDITHVVYVDPARYVNLSDASDLRAIGTAVGKLNEVLPRRRFILMGPGRWGSRGDIKLGVSVAYSDINNTAMLVEIARKAGQYVPDVSFGTHFFQDLVEASIRYLPLFPDESGVLFNEGFLTGSHNVLSELLPAYARLQDTIRVIDVPRSSGGRVLRVLMNAEKDQALAFLVRPEPALPAQR